MGDAASRRVRVSGVAVATTVRRGTGILHRVVASNTNAGAQTLTILDGDVTLALIELPAKSTLPIDLNLAIRTSIIVTPSHGDVSALVVYD